MKNAQKSDTYEPTLSDVLEAVQTGFAKVDERFAKVDERFDRHEHILTTLVEGQQNLREILSERTTAIDSRLSKVQNRIEDIVDVLEKASKSVPSIDVAQLLYENK